MINGILICVFLLALRTIATQWILPMQAQCFQFSGLSCCSMPLKLIEITNAQYCMEIACDQRSTWNNINHSILFHYHLLLRCIKTNFCSVLLGILEILSMNIFHAKSKTDFIQHFFRHFLLVLLVNENGFCTFQHFATSRFYIDRHWIFSRDNSSSNFSFLINFLFFSNSIEILLS